MSCKLPWQFSHVTSAAFLLGIVMTFSGTARATSVVDPPDDFIGTFAGTHSGDIDVLSADLILAGTNLHFIATMNGTIGTLATSLYVLGINRGAGNSNFAVIGHGGVVFDSVVTITGAGVVGGRDLVANANLNLAAFPVTVTINGSVLDAIIPLGLLPSQGFVPSAFLWNLWPRDASVGAGATAISDFAPDNSDAAVTTPLPATLPLFGAGLGVLGLLGWRRSGPRRVAA